MNFGQAFSYPFQDPDWIKKIGIMALISLIPILGQIIVLGWAIDIARRVIRRGPVVLSDLDFSTQLIDGLKAFLVGLVYGLPVFLIQAPIVIASSLAESSGSESSAYAVMILSICCSGLLILYSLALALVLPAAYGNLAAKNNLSAAFDFKTILGMVRAAPGAYLIVLLASLIVGFIGALGLIACVIGVVVTYAYGQAVMGHLYGQAYVEANRNQSNLGRPEVL